MPRSLAALALLLLALPAAAADLPEIKSRGVLRAIAVSQEPTPEFITLTAGREPGFDREIVEAFGRTQGVKVEWVIVPTWDQLVPALLEGKGDMIAGRVSHTPERARVVDFTSEVFPTRDVMFNYAPAAPVTTREQILALPKIGALRGASMVESLRALGVADARIVFPPMLPEDVRKGEPPVGAWPIEAAMVWQRRFPELQIGIAVGPPQSLAYGVAKGSPQLLAALNAHIALVKQSGTWNRLAVKYFGAQAPEILRAAR